MSMKIPPSVRLRRWGLRIRSRRTMRRESQCSARVSGCRRARAQCGFWGGGPNRNVHEHGTSRVGPNHGAHEHGHSGHAAHHGGAASDGNGHGPTVECGRRVNTPRIHMVTIMVAKRPLECLSSSATASTTLSTGS